MAGRTPQGTKNYNNNCLVHFLFRYCSYQYLISPTKEEMHEVIITVNHMQYRYYSTATRDKRINVAIVLAKLILILTLYKL